MIKTLNGSFLKFDTEQLAAEFIAKADTVLGLPTKEDTTYAIPILDVETKKAYIQLCCVAHEAKFKAIEVNYDNLLVTNPVINIKDMEIFD